MTPGLESCHALVLNADFRPLSYFPLSIWSWQDAVKAVFLDRVSVISEYDRMIHSPSFEMRLAERDRAQGIRAGGAAAGLHAVQRLPARPLHLPVLQGRLRDQRADLRSRRAEVARRPHGLDQRRHRLQPVQPAQGQPAAARERAPSAPLSRRSRRPSSCRRTAAPSRPATCTRAGATSCIGTASWIDRLRQLGPRASCALMIMSAQDARGPMIRSSSTARSRAWSRP